MEETNRTGCQNLMQSKSLSVYFLIRLGILVRHGKKSKVSRSNLEGSSHYIDHGVNKQVSKKNIQDRKLYTSGWNGYTVCIFPILDLIKK